MGRRIPRHLTRRVGTLDLFADSSTRERSNVLSLGTTIRIPAGRPLVVEGGAGSEVFVITSGTALCRRDRRTIATLGVGDFFGEIAVLDGGPRTASVIAESPLEVMVFSRRDFHRLLEVAPAVARRMLPVLARRTRANSGPAVADEGAVGSLAGRP
jgi:CRP/FNR family transcriptional regulator, cyclic AMP receptor protein